VLTAAAVVLLAGGVLVAAALVAVWVECVLLCELPHPASASAAPASGATS